MDMYLQCIKSLVNRDFLKIADLSIKENKGSYDSIVINSPATPYRDSLNDVLFARYKRNGKQPFISFNSRYQNDLSKLGLHGLSTKSEQRFVRYQLDDFIYVDSERLSKIYNSIIVDSLNYHAFGCCSRYKKCSDEKKCMHPDMLYATGCWYGKNLEQGKIFF